MDRISGFIDWDDDWIWDIVGDCDDGCVGNE